MKKKNVIRMKRLLTALIIVMLLNLVILLLPAAPRSPKNVPGAGGKENSGAEDSTVPDGENISGATDGGDFPGEAGFGNSSMDDISNGIEDGSPVTEDSSMSAPAASDKASENIEPDNPGHTVSGNDLQESAENTSDADRTSHDTPQSSASGILVFPEPSGTAASDDTNAASGSVGNNSDADNTVTLCLMGDLMCLAGQQYTAERRDGTHDYTGSFYFLRDTFTACDFVVGNLETTLSESNPYSTKEREVNEQPNCNAPADYLASLKWAGITHLVTANNHSLDGGLTGIEETIAHLEEYGIPHTGTYRMDYHGARYLMLEKNGIRIALLSFTELINQRALVTQAQLSHIID
ncbi:MAG: CapA family protein, partial [Lachnospiraceae bacterium]|nr:CapA family protein [Lachnospiraceae bacterium]